MCYAELSLTYPLVQIKLKIETIFPVREYHDFINKSTFNGLHGAIGPKSRLVDWLVN